MVLLRAPTLTVINIVKIVQNNWIYNTPPLEWLPCYGKIYVT